MSLTFARRSLPPLRRSLAAVALALAGCATKTEIVVVVTTDLAAPRALDRVTFAAHSGTEDLSAQGQLAAPGAPPLSLGLLAGADPSAELTLVVRGMRGETVAVERTVHTRFVRGERRTLRIALSSCCDGLVGRCGEGQTCGDTGECESVELPAERLEPWRGITAPANADAGAGGMCGERFPTAETTGVPAGVVLQASGEMTVGEPGTVIEGREITGCVMVNAANVTIRRSRIRCDGYYGVLAMAGGLRVEDVEIVSNTRLSGSYGVSCGECIVRRANIRGFARGAAVGSDSTLEDSFTTDGALTDGVSRVVVRHNTMECRSGDEFCLAVGTASGATDGVLVERNRLTGAQTTMAVNDSGNGAPTHVVVRYNRIGRNFGAAPYRLDGDAMWLANVWDDTGDPLP